MHTIAYKGPPETVNKRITTCMNEVASRLESIVLRLSICACAKQVHGFFMLSLAEHNRRKAQCRYIIILLGAHQKCMHYS